MARAGEVLSGATLTVEEDRREYGEERFITIGFLDERWSCSSGRRATARIGSSA